MVSADVLLALGHSLPVDVPLEHNAETGTWFVRLPTQTQRSGFDFVQRDITYRAVVLNPDGSLSTILPRDEAIALGLHERPVKG